MSQFTWVVKASKFCNMRCSYCYEYEELGKRDRMSLETWRDLFVSVGQAMQAADERAAALPTAAEIPPSTALVVIHGGEPSLLPIEYLESVFQMRDEVLGSEHNVRFVIQSNLLSISDDFIDLVRRWHVNVGFSFDVVPGVRVALGGRETEAKVVANLDRMQEARVVAGGIAVIAKHTAREMPRVYRFFAERKLWMRALPLFQGAPESLAYAYEVSNAGLATALCELFDIWLEDGAPITVEPLTTYMRTVVLRLIGARGRVFDPRVAGYYIYHVNTNGDLYHVPESYIEEKRLGNVSARSMTDLLASPGYGASTQRTADTLQTHCTGCKFAGPCCGEPLLNSHQPGDYEGRCSVGYPVHEHIERRLVEAGMTSAELLGILDGVARETAPQLASS